MKTLSSLVLQNVETAGVYFKVFYAENEFDLTIDGLNYMPIGDQNYAFRGIFDGNGAIFEVDIEKASNYVGLLGERKQHSRTNRK